jgi:hypothetical protein
MPNKFPHPLPAGWAVPGRSSSGREERAKQSSESLRWLRSTRPSRSNESGHRWREVIAGEEPLSSKRKKEEKSWPPARLGLALAGLGAAVGQRFARELPCDLLTHRLLSGKRTIFFKGGLVSFCLL